MHTFHKVLVGSLAATLLLSLLPAASAASYHVTVNTAPLLSDSSGPFALDFALTGGDSLSNFATLSNFSFSLGGSANNNPPASYTGLSSGNLSSTVSLSDSSASFFNEFFQGFTPGSTLQFDLNLSANANGPTPDAFSFAILDKNLSNIPTSGPGDSLLTIDLKAGGPSVQTFTASDGVSVSVVPEPSSALLLGGGLVGLSGFIRRRRS